MTLAGTDAAIVREALDSRDPLPGTGGFAGELDGRLVRDVLGRYPLIRSSSCRCDQKA
jgi:asparagine synthase (glutamine-hydrolysing)